MSAGHLIQNNTTKDDLSSIGMHLRSLFRQLNRPGIDQSQAVLSREDVGRIDLRGSGSSSTTDRSELTGAIYDSYERYAEPK